MWIRAVETTAIAIPFRTPYVTSRGRLQKRETVLLRLITSDGLEGTGEGVPLSLRGGAATRQVERDLLGPCAEILQAAPLVAATTPGEDPGALRGAIYALIERCRGAGVSAPALAAIDIALHDLAGRSLGLSIAHLLGARELRSVNCNATLPAGKPEVVAQLGEAWKARGFDSFKLKVGTEHELDTVAAVREAVGSNGRIRIDANGSWDLDWATAILAKMQPFGLQLVEQPVEQIEAMATLRSRTYVPLAADESVNNAAQARIAVELRACDMATVKLSKVGGISAALEVAQVLPIYLSSALDGPIGIAAAAQLAQVLPRAGEWSQLAHGLATLDLFATQLALRGPRLVGPALQPDATPGHGVELDWSSLRKLRV